MMKMRYIVRRAGFEVTLLAFRTRLLSSTVFKLPDFSKLFTMIYSHGSLPERSVLTIAYTYVYLFFKRE